jgi:hypothetical protein
LLTLFKKEVIVMKIGDHVKYFDPRGKERPAVVTNMFGNEKGSVNVAFVNDDPAQYDSYGQKIERATSVPHHEQQQAHGNYWLA